MYKQQFLVKSYQDFFSIVYKIQKDVEQECLWFRGHKSINWKLLPSALRDGIEFETRTGLRFPPRHISSFSHGQRVLLRDFKKPLEKFKEYVKKTDLLSFPVTNDFEWLYMAQHHGIKTPLLDWTDRVDMALFFATNGIDINSNFMTFNKVQEQFNEMHYVEDAAVVYILLPGKLNSQSIFTYTDGSDITIPISVTDKNHDIFLKNLYENDNITHIYFCLTAPKYDYRICTQSGNFMWQGNDVQPIDSFNISRDVLYRLIIPYCIVQDIKRHLEEEGITEEYVYGKSRQQDSLDRIAQTIQAEADNQFNSEISEITKEYKEGIKNGNPRFIKEWIPLGV